MGWLSKARDTVETASHVVDATIHARDARKYERQGDVGLAEVCQEQTAQSRLAVEDLQAARNLTRRH